MIVEFMKKSADFNQPESRNVKTQKSGRAGYGDEAIGYVGVNCCNEICNLLDNQLITSKKLVFLIYIGDILYHYILYWIGHNKN